MDFESVLQEHAQDFSDLERDFKLHFGDHTRIVESFRPNISYDLLYFKQSDEICLTNPVFTKEDFHIYFEKMIKITQTTMGDLIEGIPDVKFTIYEYPKRELKEIFFNSIGQQSRREILPAFGRIALYNSEDGKGKAPRIFFVVGHYSTLHILAFDPEHKIYPGEK